MQRQMGPDKRLEGLPGAVRIVSSEVSITRAVARIVPRIAGCSARRRTCSNRTCSSVAGSSGRRSGCGTCGCSSWSRRGGTTGLVCETATTVAEIVIPAGELRLVTGGGTTWADCRRLCDETGKKRRLTEADGWLWRHVWETPLLSVV